MVESEYTPAALVWIGLLAALMGAAAAAAYHRHQVGHGVVLGYPSLFLALLTFGLLDHAIGGGSGGFWRHAADLTFIAAYVVALFGFLREGEVLLRREQEARDRSDHLLAELQAAKGYAQLLLRSPEALSPVTRSSLEAVDRGTNRIDRLVQQLLDISSLQAGGLSIHRERVDLAEVVRQVVSRAAPRAPRHRLRTAVADGAIVEADRSRVEAVLASLVDNAIRYSPSGGDVEVGVAAEPRRIVVSVRDEGVGIPEASRSLIFERFHRAHTHTAHDYGGMGVSLYIAREVVRSHGGDTWFISDEGHGSTFFFSLPLARDGSPAGADDQHLAA